jgi:hypothetical protein
MEKSWRTGFFLFLFLCCLILPTTALSQEQVQKPAPGTEASPAETPPAKEVPAKEKTPPPPEGGYPYIVKQGDTLWNVSKQFLNNPFLWPQIWNSNKYIKNPHWIYPGDPLYIPGLEPKAVEAPPPTPSPPPPPPVEPGPKRAAPIEEKPAEPAPPKELLVPERVMRCSGYIAEAYPQFPGAIIGAFHRTTALSYADLVAINLGQKNGVKVGDKFDILRIIRKTNYPDSFKTLGYLVLYVGILQVQELAPDQSRCFITYSCQDAKLGDYVAPYQEMPLLYKKELVPAPQPLWGVVMEDQVLMQSHGGRDILFVNLGSSQGLGPGDVFEVYRPLDKSIWAKMWGSGKRTSLEETTPGGKETLYNNILGHLLVLRADANNSLCMILDGSQEVQVGFRVKWSKKSARE